MIPASKPSVGLFWGVPQLGVDVHLLFTTVELGRAERYGECLTDGRGHQEICGDWRQRGPRELKAVGIPVAVKERPYDWWPRGRVIYEIRQSRFIIYADQRLHGRHTMNRIKSVFGLQASPVLMRAVDHYRTRCEF